MISDVSIVDTGAGWDFEATGGDGTDSEELKIDTDELAELLDIRLSVTLPGPNPEGNADKTTPVGDSVRFTWQIPPGKSDLLLKAGTNYPVDENGEVMLPRLDTSGSSGGSRWLWLSAAAAILAGAGTMTMRRRRRPTPAN